MLFSPLLLPSFNCRVAQFPGKAGKSSHLALCRQLRTPLPPISKAAVFVVVSKGVPEAQGDTDVIYHISGAFEHLEGRGETVPGADAN